MSFTSLTFGASSLSGLLPEDVKNELWLNNWQEFQENMDLRLCMFNDDWNEILKEYIKSQLSTESQAQFFPPNQELPKWPVPTHINLMKRVNKERSLVYMNEPIRKMRKEIIDEEGDVNPDIIAADTGGEALDVAFEESERYEEIVSDEYNIMMMKVNQLVNTVNLVLVGTFPDENRETGIRFDLLTPDMFMPIQDPRDPSRLIGVIYVVSSTDTSSDSVITRKEHIIYMGTGEEGDEAFVATIDNLSNSEVVKEPYPYIYQGEKFLPFTVFRNDYPETGQFVNRTLGNDLYEGTIFSGWLVSLWMRNYQDSTGKQILITGPKAGEAPLTQIRDSLAILTFPVSKEDAEMKDIDFSMDLENRWGAVLKFIESVIANYGLSIDKFKSTPASGVSLKIQNQPLINQIASQWAFYRFGEKELADVIRKVNNALVPGVEAIPDDYVFLIDFGRLPFEDDPMEQWDVLLDQANKGIKAFADLYMIYDQDVTSKDEAQAAILRNKQMNRELGMVGGNTPSELPIPIEAEEEEILEPNPLLEEETIEEI